MRGCSLVEVLGLSLQWLLAVDHGSWGIRAAVVTSSGCSSCDFRALEHRLRSCDAQTLLLCGMWDFPRPRREPLSLALAHGFFTTEPPGSVFLNVFKQMFSQLCISTTMSSSGGIFSFFYHQNINNISVLNHGFRSTVEKISTEVST